MVGLQRYKLGLDTISKSFTISSVVLALSAISPPSSADDMDSGRSLTHLSLKELLSIQVRSATKTDNSLSKVPANVSVFTQEQIHRLGVETLEELLVFVPGIQVSRGEVGGGSFTISPRGRRSDEGPSRDVLLLIDGSRFNEPVTTGAYEQERQIPLYNVKRVEIIRGPGSALYGSNAFLAVINIVSDKQANYGLVGIGSFNQVRAEMALSGASNSWKYSISASHYNDDGEDYPAFYEFWGKLEDTQDPWQRNNFSLHLDYEQFEISYRFADRRYDDFFSLGAQLNGLQKQKIENQILRLTYETELADQSFTFYGERQEGIFDYFTGLFPYDPQPFPGQVGLYWSDGSIDAMVGGNYRQSTQNRIGFDANWEISSHHRLSYGATLRQEKTSLNPFHGNYDVEILESTGQLVPSSPDNFIQTGFWIGGIRFDLLNPEARTIKGLYVQDEWKLNENWNLTMGVRHDDYEDFGGHASVRSGLVFNDENHYWKVLYGEAFRAPSFIETRAGIASGGISNPNLKPEIVDTFEIIYGTNQDDWNINLTLYHNEFKDMIVNVLVDDVVVGLTAIQPQNVGNESSTGIEFEYNRKLSDYWHFNFGGDYLIDELSAQHVAKERFFGRINYQKEDFGLNFTARYLGEVLAREADGVNFLEDVMLEGYWIAGLNARWQYNPQTVVYGKVSNLFDEKYYSFTPQAGLPTGIPGRGTSVQLGVSYIFD